MSLYPSLEDMKFDMARALLHQAQAPPMHSIAMPSAPPAPKIGPVYPGLGEYMGLELSSAVIAHNMPEYQLQQIKSEDAVSNLIAPLSSQSVSLAKATVTQAIRMIVMCKDRDGKCGLRLHAVNNGVFVCYVRADSPAGLAGVRFGDQVLEINNVSLAGMTMNQCHDLLKKAPTNGIKMAVRDRPFERTITLHKDSLGHIGIHFKDGNIVGLVKDSSAACNGVLTDHQLLEINTINVVGMKDKDISKVIEESPSVVNITIIPLYIYKHMINKEELMAVNQQPEKQGLLSHIPKKKKKNKKKKKANREEAMQGGNQQQLPPQQQQQQLPPQQQQQQLSQQQQLQLQQPPQHPIPSADAPQYSNGHRPSEAQRRKKKKNLHRETDLGTSGEAGFRTPSHDEVLPAKRAKPSTDASATDNHLKVIVTDSNHREFSDDDCCLLRAGIIRLQHIFFQEHKEDTKVEHFPKFNLFPKRVAGGLKVVCFNDHTLAWLKNGIQSLEGLVKGSMSLKIIPESDLPKYQKAVINVPNVLQDTVEGLKVYLAMTNDELGFNMRTWPIFSHHTTVSNGIKKTALLMGVPPEDVSKLYAVGNRIWYQVGTIRVRFTENFFNRRDMSPEAGPSFAAPGLGTDLLALKAEEPEPGARGGGGLPVCGRRSSVSEGTAAGDIRGAVVAHVSEGDERLGIDNLHLGSSSSITVKMEYPGIDDLHLDSVPSINVKTEDAPLGLSDAGQQDMMDDPTLVYVSRQ